MVKTRDGRLICCYAPYNTFDPSLEVIRNQVIFLASRDDGCSWHHNPMLRFPEATAQGAESWVIELSDGRLFGASWHIDGARNLPNAYAVSADGGNTWSPTASTGIFGQSVGLAPLADGRVLFVYNQRRQGQIGVWLAIARPTAENFGLIETECIWAAEIAAQENGSAHFEDWTAFAFGEPSATVLPDETVFVSFWALQPSGHGIRYVKLRI